jgi:hypothetical protein
MRVLGPQKEIESLNERKFSKAIFGISIAWVIASILVTLISGLGIRNGLNGGGFEPPRPEKVVITSNQLKEALDKIEKLNTQVASMKSLPVDLAVSAEIEVIKTNLNTIEKELDVLNSAILATPEKALEIPLLKKELSLLSQQYESRTQALEREIQRANNTMQWIIGTLGLGVLGLAYSAYTRSS